MIEWFHTRCYGQAADTILTMSSNHHQLVGLWQTDESEIAAVQEYGRVSIEFSPDGSLTYTIDDEDSEQIILMTYRIEGHTLVTDQPSRPRIERTEFMFDDLGRLVLYIEGQAAFYRRVRRTPISMGTGSWNGPLNDSE